VAVPYGDHSFRVAAKAPVTAAEILELLVSSVASWLP
jgi:hypothetical protein